MAVSDLKELLKNMSPELMKGQYFIATVDESQLMALSGYLSYIIGIFREEEGLTLIFDGEALEDIKDFTAQEITGPFALISLKVRSDLMAVGFLAKITAELAAKGISVNAFSAYYHDHLFVPYERKEDALLALQQLSKK